MYAFPEFLDLPPAVLLLVFCHLSAYSGLVGGGRVMNRVSGFVCLGSSERTCPALISGACMRGREQF